MENLSIKDNASASVARGARGAEKIGLRGRYVAECRDRTGRVKWRDTVDNLITNAGKDHVLDVVLSGGSQITTWYIGLTDGTPTAAAADTAASHAGWTEVDDYDEATRPAFVPDGVSGQSVSNIASKASFTISEDATTVGGCFLVSDSTKGGMSGTLFSVGAFTGGDKVADDGDVINITYTCTA